MGKLKILGDVVEGGLNLMRGASKAEDAAQAAEKVTAAERAAAGRKAAELIKSQPQIKASEALGQLMEKGVKRTTTTQADRTRVGGGNIGGASFPAISEADPRYAGKVWGVMDEGTAARLKNLTTPDTAWTTMLGSANQLKTNPIVFDKLKRGFLDSMKQGNLSDELAGKINHNLELTFGAGADIRDPKIWKQADTFEKRAALADVMMGQGTAPSKGGVAIGGEKSGKGVIFKPTDILKKETEPTLLHTEHGGDVPTFAAGPRLFRLEKDSEFRPDLHPGFPTLLKGEDYGVNMIPTPTEVYLPDWHKRFKANNPDRKGPGYYDLALGVKGEGLPSQDLHDEYIRHLLREGFKDGGKVEDFDAKVDKLIEKHHFDSHVERKIEEHFAKGGAPKVQLKHTTLRMGAGGLLGKGAKALAGAMKGTEVMSAAEREANLAKFLEPSKTTQRLYHGTTATEGGKGQEAIRRIKPSKEGSLGSGVYLTPSPAHASGYSGIPNDEAIEAMLGSKHHADTGLKALKQRNSGELLPAQEGGNMLPVHVQMRNPLVIEGTGDPMIEALTKLGVDEDKATRMVERAYENKGYIGKEVESRARAAGYDGLMQYRNGDLSEVVSYNPNAVKSAIGNQGTYDISNPDLSKAKGGAIIKHTTLRNRKTIQAQPNRFATGGVALARTTLRGMKDGGKSEATIQATPRNKVLGKASDLLKKGHEFVSKPFGYENPPAEMLSDFIGVPAMSRVLDKLSYGEPITNMGKANVPLIPEDTFDAAGALLGGLGTASKMAKPLAKAASKLPKNIPVGLSIKPVGDIPTGAPSIIIPSKVSNVKEAVRQSKGDFGARRVERAADEIPNLEKLYKEEALRQAFVGDNAKALMTMNPKDFEKYAAPLDPRFTDKASTRHIPSGERVTYQEYMDDYLPNVGAFNDVPFLQINKEEQGLPLKPFITGHEGRHRNRVLANKGERAGLVQLLPRAELREPFPRRSQEEYLQALRDELEMTGNLVLPEKYAVPSDSLIDKQFQRPAIVLPDIYAKGGIALKHTTLRNRRANQRVR